MSETFVKVSFSFPPCARKNGLPTYPITLHGYAVVVRWQQDEVYGLFSPLDLELQDIAGQDILLSVFLASGPELCTD